MQWKELLKNGIQGLEEAGIEDASLDAWLLMEFVSGMSRAQYFLRQEEQVTSAEKREYESLIKKRRTHIPLQHLTGTQEFMGLEFLVGPEVLVPRQDTEMLVEKLLPWTKDKTVLDMCTGSGCIAISLQKLGEPSQVTAVDFSEKALAMARKNAEKNGAQIEWIQSDMFSEVSERYDLIVSNPPYIPSETVKTLMPEVREFEPLSALDGGSDGLDFYRILAEQGKNYLREGGMLWMEIGYDQKEAVCQLLELEGFQNVTGYPDLCGKDRIVCGTRK